MQRGWCSGKGFSWEHQGHEIDFHQQPYILGLSKWYLVICGIFYGSSCAAAHVVTVTLYQLKLC
jgi:hypothetical protein